MTKRKLDIITTEDGSHSLYVPELKETYHSFHGAVQESQHVFMANGLEFFAKKENNNKIKVLELGLGTGLNALLVAAWTAAKNRHVKMTSFEAYPVEAELVLGLNYAQLLNIEEAKQWFEKIHRSEWNKPVTINERFMLHKIEQKIEEATLEGEYDVIFFDAFAPNKQAELWEMDVLEKIYNVTAENGVFATYCAKGQLKRDLKALGFEVETLPGPPGKKEMVRGIKH